jgi:hypothetical protein
MYVYFGSSTLPTKLDKYWSGLIGRCSLDLKLNDVASCSYAHEHVPRHNQEKELTHYQILSNVAGAGPLSLQCRRDASSYMQPWIRPSPQDPHWTNISGYLNKILMIEVDLPHLEQWLRRFCVMGRANPVFASPTGYMLTCILRFSFIQLRYILKIPLKWSVIFLQSWTFNRLYLKPNHRFGARFDWRKSAPDEHPSRVTYED